MNISIRRPVNEDTEELHQLFRSGIKDAFKQDGIDVSHQDGIAEEVKKQYHLLHEDFVSNGNNVFFLVARTNEQIVGTTAYSKASKLIRDNYNINYQNTPEVISVYVLPEFQTKGIGSLMFKEILIKLQDRHIDEFVLDSGYRKAQSFWIKKLGKAAVILKDYWGKDFDHMIWHRKIKDLP